MTLMHYLGLPDNLRTAYLLGIKQSTPDKVLRAVTSCTGISTELLKSKTRKSYIVGPRQIAMYLLRKSTWKTLVEIGNMFGTDHSTVIYSVKKVEDLLETDKEFRKMYENIVKAL